METRRILRAIRYLNVADIKKVEISIEKRKKELNNVSVHAGDTVELLYPDDHRMHKLSGKHVMIESVRGDRHMIIIDGVNLALPKIRIKKIVKKRSRL